MTENICLPKTHLLIIFVIFIGSASWYIHKDKKKHVGEPNYKYNDMALDSLKKTISELSNKLNDVENKQAFDKININTTDLLPEDIERKLFLNRRDKSVLYNEFSAPERRQQEYSYPYNYVKNQLNMPTRGLPDNYHLMGVLLRNNTESAFNLFGRQTFPSSNQWEYYVQGNMKDTVVKIPIKIRGDKEIEDNQTIMIPGSDPSKGAYKVKLYNYDSPRYNPFV
jgi:hypothetical protein